MRWDLVEMTREIPDMIKYFFVFFLLAFFWLSYYFFSHYILAVRLKKHFKSFKKLKTAKTPGEEIGPIIDQQLTKNRNPRIKNLYRAFSALTAASRGFASKKYKREIDYFLDRRKLQIKGLAIVLLFSMAALILVRMKIWSLNTIYGCKVSGNITMSSLLPGLLEDFLYNISYPLTFALAETFLAFWLINSIKKLHLWLDREWANLLEETAFENEMQNGKKLI